MSRDWQKLPNGHFLKVFEVVEILGTTRTTIYRLIHTSQLPARRINDLFYIDVGDLRRLLDRNRVKGVKNV